MSTLNPAEFSEHYVGHDFNVRLCKLLRRPDMFFNVGNLKGYCLPPGAREARLPFCKNWEVLIPIPPRRGLLIQAPTPTGPVLHSHSPFPCPLQARERRQHVRRRRGSAGQRRRGKSCGFLRPHRQLQAQERRPHVQQCRGSAGQRRRGQKLRLSSTALPATSARTVAACATV